jgi:hypothetical protein
VKDAFYYVTFMKENYAQPDLPVDRSYLTLGADSCGCSDMQAALRRADAHHRVHHLQCRHPKILDHIGVETQAPRIAPARGPPLWDDCGVQEVGEGVEAEPDCDLANQSPPDYPDDQRTAW